MPAVSAINPLRTGIDAALVAAGVSMHLGKAPRSAALPYVILGPATENEDGARLSQAGHDQTVQLGCWASDLWAADDLYNQIKGVLHGATLTVAGHKLVRAEVIRVTDFIEPGVLPDAKGPWCVVGRLSTRTMVT